MPGNRADKAAAPEANEQDEKPSQAPRQSKHAHEDAAEAFSEQAASIQSTQGTQNLEHPRAGMSGWRWALIVASIYLTNLISGYDICNVANIQPRLYEAFGNIALLPWLGLSFSLAFFASQSLSRKVVLCFDLKSILLVSLVLFIAGAAISAASHSMATVIVGRAIMGMAAAHAQTSNLSYLAVLATPAEMPRLIAGLTATWAAGLVVGGPVGSAFAANPRTTWRWAFYINIPWAGLSLVAILVCLPRRSLASPAPLMKRLAEADPLGIACNIASPVLLAVALTFCGPLWSWRSRAAIGTWVAFAVVSTFWAAQQRWAILTTRPQQALPVRIFSRTDLLPIWMAQAASGALYAVTLYYTPLYFAFARGLGPLPQTERLLPFVFGFIVVAMLVGATLPLIGRYRLLYVLGGAVALAGGASVAATMAAGSASDAQVMGLTALVGVGLGMVYQHGIGISNVINKHAAQDRIDSSVMCYLAQMGGIALTLAFAGCIFQNVGFRLLEQAIGDQGYSEWELREALAGLSSVVWQTTDEAVLRRGVRAVAKVIGLEYYIVASSGAVCLTCGLLMRGGKLDYGRGLAAETEQGEAKADGQARE